MSWTTKHVIGQTGTNRRVAVQWNSEVREYRCRLYVADQLQPEADYFTDDREDALGTAQVMARESKRAG